jgi:hypothetical protein
MYKYKTADGTKSGVIPNVGELKDGIILSEEPLENPNLELVDSDVEAPAAPEYDVASAQPQPITANIADRPEPAVGHTPADAAETQTPNGDIEL